MKKITEPEDKLASTVMGMPVPEINNTMTKSENEIANDPFYTGEYKNETDQYYNIIQSQQLNRYDLPVTTMNLPNAPKSVENFRQGPAPPSGKGRVNAVCVPTR